MNSIRDFMPDEITPIINDAWTRARFPFEILPAFKHLGIADLPYSGARPMLDGFVAMEMSCVDPSIATFHGVHSGLATGSIALCGSEEQKQRWLPDMATAEKIGAFGLTEPNVGSGTSRGMQTAARRHGEEWVLYGEKKWIGNATFADLVVIWARDVADTAETPTTHPLTALTARASRSITARRSRRAGESTTRSWCESTRSLASGPG